MPRRRLTWTERPGRVEFPDSQSEAVIRPYFTVAVAVLLLGAAPASAADLSSDFNGDGRADLAAGIPGDQASGVQGGAAGVLYSGAGGLAVAGNQLWTQNSPGIPDVAEPEDSMGDNVVAGDFDADGFADLAVSSSYEDVGAIENAGAVDVIYGTASGLSGARAQRWTQDSPGILDQSEDSDILGVGDGQNMATGDLNGDGYDDLVIGAGWEEINGQGIAGGVNVIYGSPTGLTATGNQHWSQDSPGILDQSESIDFFGGYDNSVGDFNADGYDDMASGASFENNFTGAVNVIYGSAGGLTSAGNQFWTQNSPGVLGEDAEYQYFGDASAAGDVNADGYDDLIVGAHNGVHVLFGSTSGLTAAGDQLISQSSPGISGTTDPAGDEWATDMATGDFNKDGVDDLILAAPNEDPLGLHDAGEAHVIYGSAGVGLVAAGNRRFSQDSPGIPGKAEPDDLFGFRVVAHDFNGDGYDDVGTSAGSEDGTNVPEMGALHAIYGGPSGLQPTGGQYFHQAVPGILGLPEEDDQAGHDVG